ncbi:MAG: aminoacyl-tRNA hydrolase [Anaerolineae bacterium]
MRYLIVGLGNPGSKYEKTRHNFGFWVVEELAKRHNLTFAKTERKAMTADGLIGEKRVLLSKPQTYMNLSGEAVRALVDFYKVEVANILVVHDDLDIPLGTLRLRQKGSAGGQNGIKSIIQHLGTQDFNRVRCGIGRPPGKMDPAAYVLKSFAGDDAITAQLMTERAADAVETWLKDGIDLAMTRYNGNIDEKKPV